MTYKRFINIISFLFIFIFFIFVYVNFVKADVHPLYPHPGIKYKIFLTQKLKEDYCLITFDEFFNPKEQTITPEEYGVHKKEKASTIPFDIDCKLDSVIEKHVKKLVLESAFMRKSDLEKLGISKGGFYTLIEFNDMVNKKISPYTSPSEDILILKIDPIDDLPLFWALLRTWVISKHGKFDFNNMNLKQIVINFLQDNKKPTIITDDKRIKHLLENINMENIITFADIKNKMVLIKFSTEKDKKINMNIIKKKPIYNIFNEFVEVEYLADLDIKNNYVTLTKIKETYIELTSPQPSSSQSLLLNLWLKIKCFFLRLIGKAC